MALIELNLERPSLKRVEEYPEEVEETQVEIAEGESTGEEEAAAAFRRFVGLVIVGAILVSLWRRRRRADRELPIDIESEEPSATH